MREANTTLIPACKAEQHNARTASTVRVIFRRFSIRLDFNGVGYCTASKCFWLHTKVIQRVLVYSTMHTKSVASLLMEPRCAKFL